METACSTRSGRRVVVSYECEEVENVTKFSEVDVDEATAKGVSLILTGMGQSCHLNVPQWKGFVQRAERWTTYRVLDRCNN